MHRTYHLPPIIIHNLWSMCLWSFKSFFRARTPSPSSTRKIDSSKYARPCAWCPAYASSTHLTLVTCARVVSTHGRKSRYARFPVQRASHANPGNAQARHGRNPSVRTCADRRSETGSFHSYLSANCSVYQKEKSHLKD